MGIAGLDWQVLPVSLDGGLASRDDVRAHEAKVTLDICRDAQFDEIGGLQTRKPLADVGINIFGGGTITNPRRIVEHNGERLLFTDTTLYGWSSDLSAWVSKGTHLACKVDETPRFVTTGDQLNCDRAELGGVVVYAWAEQGSGSIFTYAAVIDKATGTVLVAPTAISINASYVRVVALATKILIVYQSWDIIGSNFALLAWTVDPASPSLSFASPTPAIVLASGDLNLYFDVVKIPGADTAAVIARRTVTTSYTVATITAGLTVTTSTKARACDGPCAIAPTPNGANLQVLRTTTGGHIVGDLLVTSTLADVTTGQVLGTTTDANLPLQITGAFRSVANGGQFRCYMFWTDTTLRITQSNFVDTAGAIGTAAVFVRYLSVGSRAFDYNGSVYVWGIFDEANYTSSTGFSSRLQNTYFLYRDDGFLVAKGCPAYAGGQWSTGRLPGVALTGSGSFSWCGQRRRVITLGGAGSGFAQRAPQDITFTFDSNEARRCVSLGQTLYITGGEILQYDGVRLAEVGFHVTPWSFLGTPLGSGGSLSAGTYAYKFTLRWENAAGEIERSSTATVGTITAVANDKVRTVGAAPVQVTHKTAVSIFAAYAAPAYEAWRTLVNPTIDAPFFLVSSKDPAITANPNRYLANDTTSTTEPTIDDSLSDTAANGKEINPENGGILESIAPPAATVITANEDRVFLAGIAGDPDRVWYSKQRQAGEIAAFNDALTFPVPRTGGAITAVSFLPDGTVVVFRATATYAFPGVGFDNAGGGANYGPPRMISLDIGASSAEAVALYDHGLIFKSARGWHVLTPGLQLQYIGAPVYAFDAEAVLATTVLTAQHQVRIVTTSRVLVYDYLVEQWGEDTISNAIHATLWGGAYATLAAAGPKLEQASYSGTDYGIDIETAWIKPTEVLTGAMRCRWFHILGEFRSAFRLRVRTAYDYTYDGAGNPVYTDDTTWTPSPSVVGSALQLRRGLSRQQCEAIKIRITALGALVAGTFDFGGRAFGLLAGVGTVFTAKTTGVHSITVTLTKDNTNPATLVETTDGLGGGTMTFHVKQGTTTVAQIEALIASSTLATVTHADGTPGRLVDVDTIAGLLGSFAGGGAFFSGDSLKLTQLELELGVKRGTYKRLPAAQKA